MFSNQWPTKRTDRSRKRAHEAERNVRPESEKERNALEASDLVDLFHELALFDEPNERIIGKDIICQEFIDRIGKLYKPVLMEQSAYTRQMCMNKRWVNVEKSKNVRHDDDCKSTANERFEKDQWAINKNLLIENDATIQFRQAVLKYCSEELLLPFSNFEDIVMGLAVSCLGEAFSFNEILCKSLCEYINTMSKKMVRHDEGSEYDCDSRSGIFNTHNRKRRKIMSECLTFE